MISVALPVVKTRYFEEALTSVLAQTFGDFELIVVDNEADADVAAIVARHPDERVRVVRHDQRLPVIQNWNRCLSYAQREWFVLASDDDLYGPEYLDAMVRLIEQYPQAGVYHCRPRIIDERGAHKRLAPACPAFEDALDFLWHRTGRMREQFISDWTWRTAALREAGGFVDLPGAWFSDEATVLRQAHDGGIACSPVPAFSYRESAISLTSTSNVRIKLEAIRRYRKIVEDFLATVESTPENDSRVRRVRFHERQRLERMKYRLLLERGPGGLPDAIKLIASEGATYDLSLGRFVLAGLLATLSRSFDGPAPGE